MIIWKGGNVIPRNFYISDCHFFHGNIIKFDNRPFSSVEEMNNEMIKRWNSVVTKQDNVYILGDFSWGTPRDTKVILDQLAGAKFLIKGNHDRWVKDGACKKMFQGIYDYKMIVDNNKAVVMCHYPIMFYQSQHRNAIHLYGHVHNTIEEDLFQQVVSNIKRQTDIPMNCYNVGCMMDYMDYTPRTLEEIINFESK